MTRNEVFLFILPLVNNLKELLFEIKQHQQKLAILAEQRNELQQSPAKVNTVIINSLETKTLDMTTMTVSIELRDTIEHLSQHLFEFLKQDLRLEDTMSNSSVLSPPNSPAGLNDRPISDSTSLTLIYSQYSQVWNLIEATINVNISQQQSPKHQPKQSDLAFHLPKEAYVNMFQEINNYANNTNQTYLIDSGINTSQLRRKHHFMVMLKSLKFKFQLFIVNLLNYKQIANWFEFLNKDKSMLKKFYDLKLAMSSNNCSGDSGVGEFLSTSGSSSLNSSLSLSTTNQNLQNSSHLLAVLSVTSLANVSIFENEEYFNYYHKLLQQFNFIEFNLTSFNVNHEKYILSTNILLTPPTSTLTERKSQKPAVPSRKPTNTNRKLSGTLQHKQLNHSTIPNSPSTPNTMNTSSNTNNGVLKSISKRFNIKSWFSNSHNSHNSNQSPNLKQKQFLTSQSSTSSSTTSNKIPLNKMASIQTTPPQSMNKLSLYDTTPTAKCCQNLSHLANGQKNSHKNQAKSRHNNQASNLMKHSLSEPSLNALIN